MSTIKKFTVNEIQIYNFMLSNIYLFLGSNLLSDSINKLEYSSNFIFLNHIPDFTKNNENIFIEENLDEYKKFIINKIENIYKENISLVIRPCFHIIFKLHELFPKSYTVLIMYNQMYDNIKALPIDSCFIRYKFINSNNEIKTLKSDIVFDSCLFHAYNIIGIPEQLNYYVEKVFMCREYKLLLSELDYLDTYDITTPKYNNLKWLIFKCSLEEATSSNNFIELDKIIDITQIPPINSSKFSIYMSWYLLQKLNNKSVPSIIIPNEYLHLNINKIYNYFINLDSQKIKAIIKWISDYDFGTTSDSKLNLLNRYSIDTLFNLEGQIYKTEYDYIDNTKYIIKVEDNKYKILLKPKLINSDNYFDNINFNDYNTDSEEEANNKKISSNTKTAHIGGFNKVDGFYKFKMNNNDIINIISPLPFCKMFYFIRYFT